MSTGKLVIGIMAAAIGICSTVTTWLAGSHAGRAVVVNACGHSYPAGAGQSVSITVSGTSCAVKVGP